MTLPEVLLWQELRKRPAGLKFRRQHPIDPYVADFFCASAGLVVEVDGSPHDHAQRAERDAVRDDFLRNEGLVVLRFAAADILKGLDPIITVIVERAGSPLHHAAHGPPPRTGEELQ